jgi:hypothetical protein
MWPTKYLTLQVTYKLCVFKYNGRTTMANNNKKTTHRVICLMSLTDFYVADTQKSDGRLTEYKGRFILITLDHHRGWIVKSEFSRRTKFRLQSLSTLNRTVYFKMAATELVRLDTNIVCDSLINRCRHWGSWNKNATQGWTCLFEPKQFRHTNVV